jgi:hypothetical protein
MKQTLFLGVATMMGTIGSFLASRQHYYSAYALFAAAIAMAIVAIWVTYRGEHRLKRGKKELGRILIELSQCELAAYDGKDGSDYDGLLAQIKKLKDEVHEVAEKHLDSYVEARFLAVNVLDVQLDEATKRHFIDRAQGDFWTMYQQIKGWRMCVDQLLRELPRS